MVISRVGLAATSERRERGAAQAAMRFGPVDSATPRDEDGAHGSFDEQAFAIFEWNADGVVVRANGAFVTLTGRTEAELERGTVHLTFSPGVDPGAEESRANRAITQWGCVPAEVNYVRADGSLESLRVICAAGRNGGIGMVLDPGLLQGRRVAGPSSHLDATHLVGHLIEREDAERRGIARELHDDLAQRVAVLELAIGSVRRNVGNDATLALAQFDRMKDEIRTFAAALRALSYRTYPVLEHGGLVPALRTMCDEINLVYQFPVTFVPAELSDEVSPEIALCLYRIAHEALHNAARHSRARGAEIRLTARGRRASLTIRDRGNGFDVADRTGAGLGLVLMAERARIVEGTFTVVSAPGQGTEVRLDVTTPEVRSTPTEAAPEDATGPKLTPRQRQVLKLVAEGYTMKQVARLLNVSRRTAESHKYQVMTQLGVHSAAQLVPHAIRMGLFRPPPAQLDR